MAATGKGAVMAAVVGNSFLTVIKFGAFLLSGSGAMLSEAIHSAADTTNQALLYLGIRRSQRPADRMFHYGYGGERFLFALLSAIGIFVLGCGVTVYHGIDLLIHPHELELDWIVFVVLGISLVVDGIILASAMRAVNASKGDTPFFEYLRTSSDPTVLAVLFEDLVACIGVLVAAAGILLSHLTGSPVYDALASIVIGLMLGMIAVWLGYRNRQLILGPAIPDDIEKAVVAHIREQDSVNSVHDIMTRIVASDRFRLKAEIDYNGRHLGRAHAAWVAQQLAAIGESEDPEGATASFAEDFGERVVDDLAREVDRIEAEIVERFPNLRYLDLESH